ncbi:MAG: YbaK/EbsC family protein [Intrasporangiaceae bacterium]|mgnify:CR=1 FL=1|nr:YbaK/EbsC family protein [Intrasporangiaceae bacterium]
MHERQEGTDPSGDNPLLTHPTVVPVREALAAYATGIGANPPQVTVLPDAVRTAAAAAEALGTTPAHIANSLIFVAVSMDGHRTPLLVLASGGARVDTDVLADSAGTAAVERADAGYVRAETGFAIGGVAPVGHRTSTGEPLRTIVDVDLEQYEQIWAAAGHSHTVFPTTYPDLVAMTHGEPLRVR